MGNRGSSSQSAVLVRVAHYMPSSFPDQVELNIEFVADVRRLVSHLLSSDPDFDSSDRLVLIRELTEALNARDEAIMTFFSNETHKVTAVERILDFMTRVDNYDQDTMAASYKRLCKLHLRLGVSVSMMGVFMEELVIAIMKSLRRKRKNDDDSRDKLRQVFGYCTHHLLFEMLKAQEDERSGKTSKDSRRTNEST